MSKRCVVDMLTVDLKSWWWDLSMSERSASAVDA
jgi:hypothetical protein